LQEVFKWEKQLGLILGTTFSEVAVMQAANRWVISSAEGSHLYLRLLPSVKQVNGSSGKLPTSGDCEPRKNTVTALTFYG